MSLPQGTDTGGVMLDRINELTLPAEPNLEQVEACIRLFEGTGILRTTTLMRALYALRDIMTDMTREPNAEELAKTYHDTYEALAASFHKKPHGAPVVRWDDLPTDQRSFLVHVYHCALIKLRESHEFRRFYGALMIGDNKAVRDRMMHEGIIPKGVFDEFRESTAHALELLKMGDMNTTAIKVIEDALAKLENPWISLTATKPPSSP